MEQLLRIHTQPLKYELDIQHAQLKRRSSQSVLEMNRQPGRLSLDSQPAKLMIDSSAARDSVTPTLSLAIRQAAADGVQAADNYAQKLSEEAKMLVKATPSQDVLYSIIRDRASYPTGQFDLGFIPTTGPDIKYQEGHLDTQYQQDKLTFDVRVSHGDVEYIPGSVKLKITQWPDVMIEYIGKPRYIPPRDEDSFTAQA